MRYLLPLVFFATPALADLPVVEDVTVRQGSGGWTFDVTVRHADEGWDHYADGWTVLTEDGTVLGHRELLHPHVEEQPFTRSLSGVAVPEEVRRVIVRAHDSVHGWGDPFEVELD